MRLKLSPSHDKTLFAFSLSFSQECRVEVSRSYMMYDSLFSVSNAEADTKIHSLLLSQTVHRFALPFFTLNYFCFGKHS